MDGVMEWGEQSIDGSCLKRNGPSRGLCGREERHELKIASYLPHYLPTSYLKITIGAQ